MTDREKLIELLKAADRYEFEETRNSGVYDIEAAWGYIADHLIANGVRLEPKQATSDENNRWIPVSERLPGENGDYLVFKGSSYGGWCEVAGFAKDGSEVDEYDLGGCENVWYDYDSEYGYIPFVSVTHWMPLPEPPKEGNK